MERQNSQNYYDKNYFSSQGKSGISNAQLVSHFFSPYIQSNDIVLDFGCGGGFLLNVLRCGSKYGFDVNTSALQHAKGYGITTFSNLDDVPSGFFDVIISNSALEHDPNPRDSLLKLKTKLKDEGKIIFRVPHETLGWKYKPDDWNYHLFTWSPMALGNLFNDVGFQVVSVNIEKEKAFPGEKIFKKPSFTYSVTARIYRLVRLVLDELEIKVIGVDGYSIIFARK